MQTIPKGSQIFLIPYKPPVCTGVVLELLLYPLMLYQDGTVLQEVVLDILSEW